MTAAVATATAACARLPYTTQTIYEGPRVVVTAQRTIDEPFFTHPVALTSREVAALLKGFSLREQQRLPLRWFVEEAPPSPIFREDEIELVAPYLVEAFQRIGPDERAQFALLAPGNNPKYGRHVVSGWMAVREPYLYLMVERYRSEVPVRQADLYDRNYPTPPPSPKEYILYFDPGRFWVTDPKGVRAVEFRKFLKSGEAGLGTVDPSSIPPAAR
jgi:hypothetical protein